MKPYLYLVSGPPGAGKTSVLERLAETVTLVPEHARRVLARERASGGQGTGEQDPDLFITLMLQTALSDAEEARRGNDTTLFDRGLPDLLAFAEYYQRDDADIREALAQVGYARQAFWFPPWEEIYTVDDERRMSFQEAAAFGARIRTVYLSLGFELIEVPCLSVPARADFIRAALAQSPLV